MDAARTLTQESLFLEGRQDFFQGRALLFDKKFPEAANLLEQAVRIDPGAAYGFNALGIAYLEQAQYEKAIPAFRDAVRRAQHWSYPLHNVALAYVETGDYQIGHPRLSRSDSADAAVQLFAIQSGPGLSALESPQRRGDGVYESGDAGAQLGGALQRAGHVESIGRQASRSRAALPPSFAEGSRFAACASQPGAVIGRPEGPREPKPSICGART